MVPGTRTSVMAVVDPINTNKSPCTMMTIIGTLTQSLPEEEVAREVEDKLTAKMKMILTTWQIWMLT